MTTHLVELDEDAVVDLPQPQELQHLADLGVKAEHTPDPDHERQLRLGRHVEVALLLGLALQHDLLPLSLAVLLDVLLGPLEDELLLLLTQLPVLEDGR